MFLKPCILCRLWREIAKKESRLKFYRMSFASHSIDICIFFYALNKIMKVNESKR